MIHAGLDAHYMQVVTHKNIHNLTSIHTDNDRILHAV